MPRRHGTDTPGRATSGEVGWRNVRRHDCRFNGTRRGLGFSTRISGGGPLPRQSNDTIRGAPGPRWRGLPAVVTRCWPMRALGAGHALEGIDSLTRNHSLIEASRLQGRRAHRRGERAFRAACRSALAESQSRTPYRHWLEILLPRFLARSESFEPSGDLFGSNPP
jgi:hypothetical protein